MGDEITRLFDLIELVADGGSNVDWQALEDAAPDESLKAAIRDLRTVAGVNAVHASQVVEDASTTPTPAAAAGARPPIGTSPPAVSTGFPAADQAGQSWGNFRLVRKVGEGSYGEVYEALDTFLNHHVAL